MTRTLDRTSALLMTRRRPIAVTIERQTEDQGVMCESFTECCPKVAEFQYRGHCVPIISKADYVFQNPQF